MYFLLYRNISIGGIETLILREACWINEHTESRSMVLCFELSEQMRSSFEASGIDYKLLASWSVNEISKELRSAQTVEMIKYFSFEDYLKFVIHDPDLFENYKTMYHCVHPLNACILKANNWIRKSFWKALSNVTRYMVETKRFRFMDDESINQTLGYYGLDVKESYKEDYIRIPYQIKDLAFKNMDGSGNRNVLAIARAEFPFKGYLLGLIDVIPDVLDRYSNTFITIISSGDGLSRLENKIKQLPEKYKNHIGLYNDKKPEDLDAYYQEADIFIGMGTTVLEAANYGIPVIMAKPYTEEFISNGLFHIAPTDIGNCSINGKPGKDEIMSLLEVDAEHWQLIQSETKRQLVLYYDIQEVMKQSIGKWDKKVSVNAIKKDLKMISLLFWLKQIKGRE